MKPDTLKKVMFIGAVCAALGPVSARADDPARKVETRSVTVSYSDLNLANPAGVATLYARLQLAARQVCGQKDTRFLDDVADWQKCRDTALEQAVGRIANPRLTALHEMRQGGPDQAAIPVAGLQ